MHNKFFKRTAALCAAVMTISTLSISGCSKKDSILNKQTPTTVKIWHYYNGVQQTKFDQLVKEFNNTVGSEKGIIVEAFTKNGVNELSKSIIASVDKEPNADPLPNIITCYSDTAYQIDKKNVLVDLKKYFNDKELEEYIPEYINEGKIDDDGIKILPTAKSTEVMMINRTDWDKFAKEEGVTYDDLKTWESLVSTAQKYYDYTDRQTPDIPNDGKAFFGRDAVANYMIVGAKQLEGDFVKVDKNKNAVVKENKKAARRLWDNFYVPFVKGYFAAEGRYRSDDVKIGKIIALVGSTAGASYFSNEVTINDEYSYNIENSVLPVPNFKGTKPYIVQQGAGMAVIKSDEKTELACAEFMKWFTNAENNIEFSAESGYLPVKKEANNFKSIKKVINDKKLKVDKTMLNVIDVAIEEINDYTLYAAMPFNNSNSFRNALSAGIEEPAIDNYKKAWERIGKGEDRQKVLNEYTGDAAFEKWYKDFDKGLTQALSGK